MITSSPWVPTLCFWLFAAVWYYFTLHIAERRQAKYPSRLSLSDLGFDYTPAIPELHIICDTIGVIGVLWMACVLGFGSGDQGDMIRAMCDYHAVGNMFSASLHAVTILPSAEFKASSVPLMGGRADKLMSNHTFNFGMFLHCLRRVHELDWAAWVIPSLVLVYSYAMLCTRGHYSVDIVLAWWAFLALVKLNPRMEPLWV